MNTSEVSATSVGGGDSRAHAAPGGLALVAVHPAGDPARAGWLANQVLEIGRGAGAHVRLDDDSRVSRSHATVARQGGELRVRDLNSRHGTFVDGARVPADGASAGVGSVLRIGQTLLLVVQASDATAPQVRRIDGRAMGLPADVIAGPRVFRCWQLATQVASLNQPALILGESGSGKEALARVLHAARSQPGPFVALNVAAIPADLFEAAMFGHERGAFTGAASARLGAFREAAGGVLFMDEVGELRLESQAALLRAIDQGQVRPIGASADVRVPVRVVAATSRNLAESCENGSFRKDLYYRLSGIVIEVPPLRERRTDILALAASFFSMHAPEITISVAAAEQLLLADWEGNVRQLQNALTHAQVALTRSGETQLCPEHLPELVTTPARAEITREALNQAMSRAQGNASSAARLLGVSRTTLYNLFKRHGVEPSTLRGDPGT